MRDSYILIITTCEKKSEATVIAQKLVESKLAACVQISSPIHSIYRWKEVIEESDEWILTIKSHSALFDSVCQKIREYHSYETPEIFSIPIEKTSPETAEWLQKNLKTFC